MASILLDNCNLDLPIYGVGNRSLKQIVMAAASGGRIASDSRKITVVHALREINLHIKAGDRVGLVGHNGAGKSSLLRMLAGVFEPSAGRLRVEGSITSLIDVSLGMDHEATGYDNILLRGLVLGLSRKEIKQIVPDVREFSELGDYLAMPVRMYSTGMVLRLAFSIVTCVHPDILLMDEWLSVGDADFVRKAENRLMQMVSKASILVIASHNAAILDKLCNIHVRLEQGRIASVTRA